MGSDFSASRSSVTGQLLQAVDRRACGWRPATGGMWECGTRHEAAADGLGAERAGEYAGDDGRRRSPIACGLGAIEAVVDIDLVP